MAEHWVLGYKGVSEYVPGSPGSPRLESGQF